MDWRALTLFLLVLARMSGVVLFNPILGRQSIPGVVKSGFILLLSITAYTMTDYRPEVPDMILVVGVRFLLELGLGYILGLVMNVFFYIPLLGGETIDTQMGMSMGKTYDPGSQSSVSVTASLLNILMILLFLRPTGTTRCCGSSWSRGGSSPSGRWPLARSSMGRCWSCSSTAPSWPSSCACPFWRRSCWGRWAWAF